MAKHPNRVPKYTKKPDYMRIEAARELGVEVGDPLEISVALASQGEPKFSKKTMNKKHRIRTEYKFKNRED